MLFLQKILIKECMMTTCKQSIFLYELLIKYKWDVVGGGGGGVVNRGGRSHASRLTWTRPGLVLCGTAPICLTMRSIAFSVSASLLLSWSSSMSPVTRVSCLLTHLRLASLTSGNSWISPAGFSFSLYIAIWCV